MVRQKVFSGSSIGDRDFDEPSYSAPVCEGDVRQMAIFVHSCRLLEVRWHNLRVPFI